MNPGVQSRTPPSVRRLDFPSARCRDGVKGLAPAMTARQAPLDAVEHRATFTGDGRAGTSRDAAFASAPVVPFSRWFLSLGGHKVRGGLGRAKQARPAISAPSARSRLCGRQDAHLLPCALRFRLRAWRDGGRHGQGERREHGTRRSARQRARPSNARLALSLQAARPLQARHGREDGRRRLEDHGEQGEPGPRPWWFLLARALPRTKRSKVSELASAAHGTAFKQLSPRRRGELRRTWRAWPGREAKPLRTATARSARGRGARSGDDKTFFGQIPLPLPPR